MRLTISCLSVILLAAQLALATGCARLLTPLERSDDPITQNLASPALIRIATCWAGLPLAEDLAQAYAPEGLETSFDIVPTSSTGSVDLLLTGLADLAIVGEQAATTAPGTAITPLALDAICVVVNANSPLHELGQADLVALFGGYHLDWSTLGGPPGQPELVSREGGADARRMFENRIMGEQAVSTAALIVSNDPAIIDYVASYRLAVGYASRASLDPRVTAISIDGAAPTDQALRDEAYPMIYPLVLLTLPGMPDVASRFASFCTSASAQRIIEERYVLPPR